MTEDYGRDQALTEVTADMPAETPLEEKTLEEAFARLEQILAEMDRDDLPLEEAFSRYEEGMKLLRHCSRCIDRVEKKVMLLSEDGVLEEFT